MVEQIRILAKIELCNLYGLNVFRHRKEESAKKKSIALAAVIGVLLLFLMFYMGGMSYGLILLGAADVVPAYLIVLSSVIIVVLSALKAGGIIFRNKGYDMISSLPLSNWAVVISRFIRLYVENFIITLLIMIPGLLVYAILLRPSIGYHMIAILSLFATPLIPVAIATGIGALITGIASRMKHKALAEAVISVVIVMGIFAGSASFSSSAEEFSLEKIQELMGTVSTVLGKVYPPAILLGNAIVQGDVFKYFLFAVISILSLAAVVAIVSMNFHGICRRLYSTTAKHDYKMESLQKNSVLKALVLREAKRYFASGVYVTNTIIGPIMGTIFCVALLFIDMDSILGALPISINLNRVIPFVMAGIFCLMNTTATSISMEGKEWWIAKSLPLTAKNIFDGKILFSLCLLAPFYLVSEIVLMIALKGSILEKIWCLLIPALIIVFISVFGITVNLKFPKMEWESEVEVVKQSASSLIGGMAGFLVAILCAIVVLLAPESYTNIVNVVIGMVLVLATVFLYHKNNKTDLRNLK